MHLITAIALIWFAVSVAIIVTAALSGNGDGVANGLISVVLLFASITAFQTGAHWQRIDTLENYNLIRKEVKP